MSRSGQGYLDALSVAFGKRPAGLEGVRDDGPQIHARLSQLQFIARDATDIEEIVDETDQVGELAPEYVPGVAEKPRIPFGAKEDLERVANRGQRVPQFMRQRREKLIFTAIVFSQRRINLFALADIPGDFGGADHASRTSAKRRHKRKAREEATAAGN